MPANSFSLEFLDYLAFGGFFVILSAIGYWAGRGEQKDCDSYFLAGKKLPWYVVGGSYIASSISTEHFIGMIGATYIYGIAIAQWEWANLGAYTFLIFLFIPFLLASRVFTIPEFLEKRFSPSIRILFATITLITNIFIFLAAVLYSGGLALQEYLDEHCDSRCGRGNLGDLWWLVIRGLDRFVYGRGYVDRRVGRHDSRARVARRRRWIDHRWFCNDA